MQRKGDIAWEQAAAGVSRKRARLYTSLVLGDAAPRGASRGPSKRSDLTGLSSSAEELIPAVGFKPGNVDSLGHVETLKNLAGSRIDSPQIALVAFPGGVPKLSINPGDTRDEAVGFDRAQNGTRLGINLIDLPSPVLSDPERSFGPRKPRVTTRSWSGDRGEHLACFWIDLLNAILSDLKQVLAVEGRSCVRGDIYRLHHFSARWVEGIQPVAGCKPDVLSVIAHSMHAISSGERTILLNDFSG